MPWPTIKCPKCEADCWESNEPPFIIGCSKCGWKSTRRKQPLRT
jgi:Zn ribbon nucleic-acid-binding protein